MSTLNQSNTDKFKTVFSNVPVPSTRTDLFNLETVNNYIKSLTLPDYNIEVVFSELMTVSIKNPISRYNNDITPITIEFTCDEDLDNYVTFWEWMNEIRRGNSLKNETTLRESTIKSLNVIMTDNQDREILKFILKDLILVNLSSLNLMFGNSDQLEFTCTFTYNDMDIERGTATLNN